MNRGWWIAGLINAGIVIGMLILIMAVAGLQDDARAACEAAGGRWYSTGSNGSCIGERPAGGQP